MISHLLNATATVYRPSYAEDGRGGREKSLMTVGPIRVKVSQATSDEQDAAARTGAYMTHTVHAPRSAYVLRGDELEVGDLRLRVVAAGRNSRDTYLRLDCEAIQHG